MKKLLIAFCLVALPALTLQSQNPRNVLIYNITDTDCGPCSCMDSTYANVILPAYPKTIVVAIHSVMPNSFFNKYQGDSIFRTFHAMYEPSGFIDGLGFDVPHFDIADSVAHRYARSPEAPVKIEIESKTWDPVSRNINLALKATNIAADMEGPFWYNVIVTESHIKHLHRTYTGCSTPDIHGLPMRENYFNNWVVRKMEYWSKGDSLIGPSWASQQSVMRNCTVSIDTAWVPENCNIVVTIYKKADSMFKANIQQAIRQSVTGGVGIGDEKPASSGIIQIYPNPSKGLTNIHFGVAVEGKCTLQIYDLSGRVVETIVDHRVNPGLYNAELDTSNFPEGIYLCVLKTVSGQSQQKLVIR
jgi:hypothetical protein